MRNSEHLHLRSRLGGTLLAIAFLPMMAVTVLGQILGRGDPGHYYRFFGCRDSILAAGVRTGHHGLLGMQERARLARGRLLTILSKRRRGPKWQSSMAIGIFWCESETSEKPAYCHFLLQGLCH